MWRALVAAVFAATTLGCGDGDLEIAIDDAFSVCEAAEIRRAVDAWNAITKRRLVVWGGGAGSEAEWLILSARVPGGWRGSYVRSRHLIRVDPTTTPLEKVFAVAQHEIGHALGLRHVGDGVMADRRERTVFTADDLAECERVGAC